MGDRVNSKPSPPRQVSEKKGPAPALVPVASKSEEYGQFPEAKYINHRIKYVAPVQGTYKLYVQWQTEEEAVVDFSKTIAENPWFRPLKNPVKFQAMQIVS